jgi:hypothetical protein
MRLHIVACLKENVRKNLTTSKNTSIHTEPAIILQNRSIVGGDDLKTDKKQH